MARVVPCLVILVLVACAFGAPGKRVRRGYGSGYGDSSSGYGGRGSDERDASVSEENSGGCNTGGYGRGYSGSRELAYNRDGRSSDTRGGRSFARSSAVASASAYAMNQKANNV